MGFERACAAADVSDEAALSVALGGVTVAIARHEDEFFALQDECSHANVPLSEGEVVDCTVECWLHGSTFDLRTGKPTVLPATEPVATFPIELRDGDVYVDTSRTLNGVTPS